MNSKSRKIIIATTALIAVVLSFIFIKPTNVKCPFTSASWSDTPEKVIELEGTEYKSYDSVYNGLTYTFPKKYVDVDGTIKYMFDDKDEIKSIAWAYSTDNIEDLDKVYDTIKTDLVSKYGESDYTPDVNSNHGDVWYLEGTSVILSALTTDSQKVLQYSYSVATDDDLSTTETNP